MYGGAAINVKGTSMVRGNLITDASAYIRENILVLVRGIQLDSMYEQNVEVVGWCMTRDHQTKPRLRTIKGVDKHFTSAERLWDLDLLLRIQYEERAM
jgi:hypothetical protein